MKKYRNQKAFKSKGKEDEDEEDWSFDVFKRNTGCGMLFISLPQRRDGGEGAFAGYRGEGGARLAGIINCSGCPTAVVPEKLLGRVRSLTELGVDAIHLASCIIALCPFKNKYLKILKERFPQIEFVEGTHKEIPGVTPEMFIEAVKGMLTQSRQTMVDAAKLVTNQMSSTGIL